MYPNLVNNDPQNNEKKPSNAGKLLGTLPYLFPDGKHHVHFYAKSDGDLVKAEAEFDRLANPSKHGLGRNF